MRIVQSTLFTLLAASTATFADTTLNMPRGVSPLSHDIYQLHMTVFWICVVIGVLVFTAMFYSMYYHRKSRGHQAASFHSHPWLEITWTILPALILVLMAIPATKVLFNMNNNDQEELTIKITGYQWKWHYEYLEDNINFFSNLSTPMAQMQNKAPKGEFYLREVDNPIVVPIHKKIRFLITSNDVNHAWWVPELGVKRDAIAGFINEAWTKIEKPGTYRGQCAELCGINHAFMPIVVIATTEEGYKDWIAKQKGQATAGEAETNKQWTKDQLMEKGEAVYGRICAACHQPTGLGLPPTFPALKGSKVATGPMIKHIETVTHGVPGTAMQAFLGQLTDVELAAVITYERNAWGNNTNTLVQPIQIKAVRDGKSFADALTVQPGAAVPQSVQPASANAPVSSAVSTVPAANKPAQQSTTVMSQPVAVEPAVNTVAPIQQATTPVAEPTGNKKEEAIVQTTNATNTASSSATPSPDGGMKAPISSEVSATQPQSLKTEKPETKDNEKEEHESQATQTSTVDPEALKAAIQRGEKVYLSTCAVCHQPSGVGMPPTFPALKGSKIVTTSQSLPEHISTVMNGHPGTAMQAFKNILKDQDIADVITYERNAWGNNTGSLIKAEQIDAARKDENNK